MYMRAHNLGTIPMPLLAILSPIIGLGYIIILPFTGLFTLLSLLVYRARQAVIMRRKAAHSVLNIRW